MRDGGLGFDELVTQNGYRWWYLDALSDDGSHGLTLIAFIGSVFSPYYAAARRRGNANPYDYCALNVVLHYGRSNRWTFTERRRDEVLLTPATFVIGSSSLQWDGERLSFDINELTVPGGRPVRGTVNFTPFWLSNARLALDSAGRHFWSPIAGRGHVEVALKIPQTRWRGSGYFDSNTGTEPLEKAFAGWHWSRSQLTDGTVVLYDVQPREGAPRNLAVQFDHTGALRAFDPPPLSGLPSSRWGITRLTRSEDAGAARVFKTLLDAPFYARSVVRTRLLGQTTTSIHESLSLDRFRSRWVQAMLRFRVARPLRLL